MFVRVWTRSWFPPTRGLGTWGSLRSPCRLQTRRFTYKCDIFSERIDRYLPDGYHPIELGQVLKNGRYKILHKIGWGSFATTWAARDQFKNRYVAIKIAISESDGDNEVKILEKISAYPRQYSGQAHIIQLLDHFTISGPNGSHSSLVLELMGPNIPDVIEKCYDDQRLPAKVAKRSARQILQAVDFLALHKIGHGDLHTGNVVFTIPSVDSLTEQQFFEKFGKPEIAQVTRTDGAALPGNVPAYLVRPASLPAGFCQGLNTSSSIKIIDFGEAFLKSQPPATLHTPLAVRAPEVIFGDQIDHRQDLWSLGCMLFELVTGQPPFDAIMATPASVVSQMKDFCSDEIPSRWREKGQIMTQDSVDNDPCTLQQWLEELYFDDERPCEFTRRDIAHISHIVEQLLIFEGSSRAQAKEILEHAWLKC